MGRAEAGSVKAIANAIKAKGLGKLRWYCQACEKQCRDENGFRCHQTSAQHLRAMAALAANADGAIDKFSADFQANFLDFMRRHHPSARVEANRVYNELIHDRHHVHMNATRWLTLTEFVKHLGKEGLCRVDETERGWFVQLVRDDPAKRAEEERKARRAAREEEEARRAARELQAQLARAKRQREEEEEEGNGGAGGQGGQQHAEDAAAQLARREEGEAIRLTLAGGGGAGGAGAGAAAERAAALFGGEDDEDDEEGQAAAATKAAASTAASNAAAAAAAASSRKRSKLDEIMLRERQKQQQAAAAAAAAAAAVAAAAAAAKPPSAAAAAAAPAPTAAPDNDDDAPWPLPGTVVRVLAPSLKAAGLYRRKGAVRRLEDGGFVAEVEMLPSAEGAADGGAVVRVDQAELETVLPAPGGRVAVVAAAGGGKGQQSARREAAARLRGQRGTLVAVDQDAYRARVRLDGEDEDRWFDYEEICKVV